MPPTLAMSAIDNLLCGLVDYAGLFPPSALDMASAVRNYTSYAAGQHPHALGRFIVEINRLQELKAVAGDSLKHMRLSIIATPDTDWDKLPRLLDEGFRIEMVEVRPVQSTEIVRIRNLIPSRVAVFFEVPVALTDDSSLKSISACGAGVKLRMGGVRSEAFPSAHAVGRVLQSIHRHRLPFKATAGLHHPLRSCHSLTYEPGSAVGMMHGFVNLCCAAALIHFGGDPSEAVAILEEQDAASWCASNDLIGCRSHRWSADQLHEVRQKMFLGFGSCSFEEPIRELEALGWL